MVINHCSFFYTEHNNPSCTSVTPIDNTSKLKVKHPFPFLEFKITLLGVGMGIFWDHAIIIINIHLIK